MYNCFLFLKIILQERTAKLFSNTSNKYFLLLAGPTFCYSEKRNLESILILHRKRYSLSVDTKIYKASIM